MFWGEKKEVLFADSPGLVCPSLVGVELQVLAGSKLITVSTILTNSPPDLPDSIVARLHLLCRLASSRGNHLQCAPADRVVG